MALALASYLGKALLVRVWRGSARLGAQFLVGSAGSSRAWLLPAEGSNLYACLCGTTEDHRLGLGHYILDSDQRRRSPCASTIPYPVSGRRWPMERRNSASANRCNIPYAAIFR